MAWGSNHFNVFKTHLDAQSNSNTDMLLMPTNLNARMEERAYRLKDRVKALSEQKGSRIHLVTWSLGGIDARAMITHLDGHQYVESLTTIASPHKGIYVLDLMRGEYGIHNLMFFERAM